MISIPKVSICIPSFNYGHFIGQAIDSVLRQDFSNYEVLVLDNASNDGTGDIVKRYNDDRLKYIRNETNIGFVANVNKGLGLSRGEYIIYLCADDIWYERILSREVNILEDHINVNLVHTAEKWINEEGVVIRINKCRWDYITSGSKAFKDFFKLGWNISFSSCMMRKSILRKVGGFNSEFGDIADSGAFLSLFLEGDAVYIKECLVGYRWMHNRSLTKETIGRGELFIAQRRLLDRVFDWERTKAKGLENYKKCALAHLAYNTAKIAPATKIAGGNKDVLKCFKEAFKIYPPIIFFPLVWARICLSLILPKTMIKWIQGVKRYYVWS